MLKKIAIVGPESTGKSTLTQQLARHYQTLWVAEYARYYCEHLTEDCTLQDEINMFHGQIALENSIVSIAEKDFIFCDITVLTVKIFCDDVFGGTPQIVLDAVKSKKYDLYLLMDIDLPWENDPLRGLASRRNHFMEIWKQELNALNANYTLISGIDNRLSNAIEVVDAFLNC